MSDPQLDALILQLRGLQDLLTPSGANQQHKLTEPIKRTIADLREAALRAKTEKEREELATTVAALANSVSVTRASTCPTLLKVATHAVRSCLWFPWSARPPAR